MTRHAIEASQATVDSHFDWQEQDTRLIVHTILFPLLQLLGFVWIISCRAREILAIYVLSCCPIGSTRSSNRMIMIHVHLLSVRDLLDVLMTLTTFRVTPSQYLCPDDLNCRLLPN